MPESRRVRLVLAGPLFLGFITFMTGINWGLPTRQADPHLFGSADRAWSGARIAAERGPWNPDANRAADADANPIAADAGRPVVLNDTDAKRAEILTRYRLFSAQPDEMLTFMSLAGMPKNRYDPRMYQYGGLWVYPVGGLLKVASMAGGVTLTADANYYLDRPEAFGRFYVVARAYSAAWGLIGIWAIFHLVRRFSGTPIWPATAAACFALMPIVINGAHEAKPHLAGTVLILLAALAGAKYVEAGGRRWWVLSGVLCGMATGMVLTAAVAFVMIPLIALLRGGTWRARVKRIGAMGAVGVLTYCATNPYVPINLVRNPAVVRENLGALGRAKALTGRASGIPAIANARRLVTDGASTVGGVIGFIALVIVAVNPGWWRANPRGRTVAILVGVPAALALIQFTTLAGGKAGEFGRFAMLPDVALVIAGVVLVANLRLAGPLAGRVQRATFHVGRTDAELAAIHDATPPESPTPRRTLLQPLAALFLMALVAVQGASYIQAFRNDASPDDNSRAAGARRLTELWGRGARTLGVRGEPAPYCLPPADVTGWTIVLLPDGAPLSADGPDVIVAPVDELGRAGPVDGAPYVRTFATGRPPFLKTRISWADKPFELLVRRDQFRDADLIAGGR